MSSDEVERATPKDIYVKALTKWMNSRIAPKHGSEYQCTTENLLERVSRGGALILLVNSLHGTPVPVYHADDVLDGAQRRENLVRAFAMLRSTEMPLSEALMDAARVASGDFSAVTELLWAIAFQFQVAGIAYGDETGEDALLRWCQERTGAPHVADFDASWRDGSLYCRLVARHRPALLSLDALPSISAPKTLDAVFTILEEKLDLAPLLDDEDVSDLIACSAEPSVFERRAVLLFLSDLYHLFAGTEQLAHDEDAAPATAADRLERWAMPRTIAGRSDLLIEWSSDNPVLQHVETTFDSALVPDLRIAFTAFMEEMLSQAWNDPQADTAADSAVVAAAVAATTDGAATSAAAAAVAAASASAAAATSEAAKKPRKFPPLKVFEANSYTVHEDRLQRLVFVTEIRENGDEVVLLGFSSEEHGTRSKPNERNRSYLQYIASSALETRENRRRSPTVAEAVLMSYARWLELTYRSSFLHIWVDPPDASYPEFIFRNCSMNVAVPWCMKNKKAERAKLMKTYQHIFNLWDLQSYLWRPEIPLPPQFEKDFKSAATEEDEVNVRSELQALLESAKQLSLRLNKFFEDRTLVVYLSEVTILARDSEDPDHLLTKTTDEAEYLLEASVEDITPLCPNPFPPELLVSNLVQLPELDFSRRNGDYVRSTARLRELVERHMSVPDAWTRDEHQRATGIVEVEEDW